MQVSCDSPVKFISMRNGASQDGRPWYRVSVSDEKGEVINVYSEPKVFAVLQGCNFGDNLQLILSITPGRTGLGVRCIDVIREN